MCQHLKDLPNSLNQYFPNDQCMNLGDHCIDKSIDSKGQNKPIDFRVTEYKEFTGTVSDFPVQLIFKKLALVEFCCNIKEYIPTII